MKRSEYWDALCMMSSLSVLISQHSLYSIPSMGLLAVAYNLRGMRPAL